MAATLEVPITQNRTNTQAAIVSALATIEASFMNVGIFLQPDRNFMLISGTSLGANTNPMQVLAIDTDNLTPAYVQTAFGAFDAGGQEAFQVIETPYNYVIVTAKVVAGAGGGGGGSPLSPVIDNHQLTGPEVAAGQVTLAIPPTSDVMLLVNAGPTLVTGVDFTQVGSLIDWSAFPFFALASAGEWVTFVYRRA